MPLCGIHCLNVLGSPEVESSAKVTRERIYAGFSDGELSVGTIKGLSETLANSQKIACSKTVVGLRFIWKCHFQIS